MTVHWGVAVSVSASLKVEHITVDSNTNPCPYGRLASSILNPYEVLSLPLQKFKLAFVDNNMNLRSLMLQKSHHTSYFVHTNYEYKLNSVVQQS